MCCEKGRDKSAFSGEHGGIYGTPRPAQGGVFMVAHPPLPLKPQTASSAEWYVPGARAELDGLHHWLQNAARDGLPAHEVERHLFDRLPRLGSVPFAAFLNLVGPGDVGD